METKKFDTLNKNFVFECKAFDNIHKYLSFLKDQKTDADIQMAIYIEREILPMWDLSNFYQHDPTGNIYKSVFTKILKFNIISNAAILFETDEYSNCYIFHDDIKEDIWQQCSEFISTRIGKKIKFTALVSSIKDVHSKHTYLPVIKMTDENDVSIDTTLTRGVMCSIL